MSIRDKYLVGVGDVYSYDTNGNLIFTSKTMNKQDIAISSSNQEIRGGMGNQLEYVYYHTSKFAVDFTETQFNLAIVASAIGSNITTGNDIWKTEMVTLGAGGTGTVSETPLVSPDTTTTIYGWVTEDDGTTTKVTFSGKNFTLLTGTIGEEVLVRYYLANAASRQVVIPANILPAISRIVIDWTLGSSSTGTGQLGTVQMEIPRCQFDASHTFSLSSTGVYSGELKGNALRYNATETGTAVYAKVTEIIDNANWYDDVIMLQNSGGDSIALNETTTTEQLDIYAIPSLGNAFVAPIADLTFISSTPATATVSSSGLITRVAAGSTIINVKITAKETVYCQIDVTVT